MMLFRIEMNAPLDSLDNMFRTHWDLSDLAPGNRKLGRVGRSAQLRLCKQDDEAARTPYVAQQKHSSIRCRIEMGF